MMPCSLQGQVKGQGPWEMGAGLGSKPQHWHPLEVEPPCQQPKHSMCLCSDVSNCSSWQMFPQYGHRCFQGSGRAWCLPGLACVLWV